MRPIQDYEPCPGEKFTVGYTVFEILGDLGDAYVARVIGIGIGSRYIIGQERTVHKSTLAEPIQVKQRLGGKKNMNIPKFAKAIVMEHLSYYDNKDKEAALQDIVDHGCSAGIVSDVIYTADNYRLFKDNMSDLLDWLDDIEQEMGYDIGRSLIEQAGSWNSFPNYLIWAAVEEAAREILGSGEWREE